MRIGIVSKWFNRGQPVVGRQLRSAVDELGHESFVLARPKRDKGPRPGALDRDGVWDQPGVTAAQPAHGAANGSREAGRNSTPPKASWRSSIRFADRTKHLPTG